MDVQKRLERLETYQDRLRRLQQIEKNRAFCRHDLAHMEKCAEIGQWMKRENGLAYSDGTILLCALLHGLGRVEEYESGADHRMASAELADGLLRELEVSEEERRKILRAIRSHGRRKDAARMWYARKRIRTLEGLLRFSDQFSRPCYRCRARRECKWREDEKIPRIKERFREDVPWQS